MQKTTIRIPDEDIEYIQNLQDNDGIDNQSEAMRMLLKRGREYKETEEEYKKRIESIQEEYEQKIDSIQKEHEKELNSVEVEYEKKIEEYEKQINSLQQELENVQNQKEKLRNEKKELRNQLQAATSTSKKLEKLENEMSAQEELVEIMKERQSASIFKRMKWSIFGRNNK